MNWFWISPPPHTRTHAHNTLFLNLLSRSTLSSLVAERYRAGIPLSTYSSQSPFCWPWLLNDSDPFVLIVRRKQDTASSAAPAGGAREYNSTLHPWRYVHKESILWDCARYLQGKLKRWLRNRNKRNKTMVKWLAINKLRKLVFQLLVDGRVVLLSLSFNI